MHYGYTVRRRAKLLGLLTAYRKSYMRNRLVAKWMTLTFVWRSYQGPVRLSTTASHSPLNISETVRDRGLDGSKGPPIGNGLWGIDCEWSRDRWLHV